MSYIDFWGAFLYDKCRKTPQGDAAMDSQFLQIQTLLEQRAEITARLNLIPYDGSIEIKDRNGQKYIYIRKY